MIIRAPAVVVYVSGHGYGHATRTGEVLRALLERHPAIELHVRTMAPRWLFERRLPSTARLHVTPVATDVGVVQRDGLSFDLADTLEGLRHFQGRLPALADEERRFLRRVGARLVLSDISPFPLAWARELSIPAIALGNFGWDAIYDGFARRMDGFARHAASFARASQAATLLLRLPFALPMEAFPRIQDVPMVVRRPRSSWRRWRRRLAAGSSDALVLVSFGGFSVRDLPVERLDEIRGFRFVVPAVAPAGRRSWRRVVFLPPEDLDHPALVMACDLVLGKPGYGLVSEVTAYQKRMLYTSRGRFPEYPVLAAALRRTGQATYCPRRDLAAGDLAHHLERALALPDRARRAPRTDGAEVAAAAIARALGGVG